MYDRCTQCMTNVRDVRPMYVMSNWCMQYITMYAMYLTFHICPSEPYICDIWPMYAMYHWCTRCMTDVRDVRLMYTVQLMYAIYNHVCHVSHFLYLSQWALYMWYMTDLYDVQLMYVMYNWCTRCTTDVRDVQLMYVMYNWCTRCTTDVRDVQLMYAMYNWCTWCTTDVWNIQSYMSCFSLFKSILVILIHVTYDCHSVSIYIYKIGKYINWLVLLSPCMITQKPEIEMQAEYWPHLHDQGFIWEL